MTTDTPKAPRFTAEELLLIAKDARANGQLTPAAAIESYAADLAALPTREELAYQIWMFTHPRTTIWQFFEATANEKGRAYRRADALIAAGVKVLT
jgi:hypothetical protein